MLRNISEDGWDVLGGPWRELGVFMGLFSKAWELILAPGERRRPQEMASDTPEKSKRRPRGAQERPPGALGFYLEALGTHFCDSGGNFGCLEPPF